MNNYWIESEKRKVIYPLVKWTLQGDSWAKYKEKFLWIQRKKVLQNLFAMLFIHGVAIAAAWLIPLEPQGIFLFFVTLELINIFVLCIGRFQNYRGYRSLKRITHGDFLLGEKGIFISYKYLEFGINSYHQFILNSVDHGNRVLNVTVVESVITARSSRTYRDQYLIPYTPEIQEALFNQLNQIIANQSIALSSTFHEHN